MNGARLDPVAQQFIDEVAGGQDRHHSVAGARSFLAGIQSAPIGRPSAVIEDLTLPAGSAGSAKLRTVRPPDRSEALPVIIHIPGVAWIPGDAGTHDRLMREIAIGAGAALVFIAYDPAAEVRYALAVEQAYAAVRYVVEHARSLNVDAGRLAVLGDGVGGAVAAAVALLAKQRRGPRIALQVLLYPVIDASLAAPSQALFADGPWLTRAALERFWNAYLPQPGRLEATASPLDAAQDRLRDLPEALVIVAENDAVRDEGEAYARKLSDAGVRVTCVRYNGTIHDFMLLNPLADTPAVRAAIAQTVCMLKATLG